MFQKGISHDPLRFQLAAFLGHRGEGIHPDAARPRHLRHDDRHPNGATHPVWLRHQFRPEAPADGGVFSRQQRVFPHHPLGIAQQQLLQHHARGAERGGHPENARAGHGAICRGNPRGLLAQIAARRKAGFAARSRRHRPVRRRLRHLGHQHADRVRAGPRPEGAARAIARPERRHFTSSPTSTTIPKTSRNTTSSPA